LKAPDRVPPLNTPLPLDFGQSAEQLLNDARLAINRQNVLYLRNALELFENYERGGRAYFTDFIIR
jgi:hypothetical protein